MPILASKMLFVCEKLLDKKIFSSFSRKFGYLLSKKDLEMKSDPFRSDPWFFGSTIRSRSFRRKWICDPITILKKEDLDPVTIVISLNIIQKQCPGTPKWLRKYLRQRIIGHLNSMECFKFSCLIWRRKFLKF